MKKILLTLISITTLFASYSQCNLDATVFQNPIDCNDTLTIDLFGSNQVLNETFTCPGGPCASWLSTGGAIYTNPYIPSPAGDTYFWMGATPVLPAALETTNYNTSLGGTLCFDFVMAVQGGAAPTEGPDLSEEGFTLQYSTDGGLTWTDITYFMPNGVQLPSNPGPGFPMVPPFNANGTPYTVWNSICIPIPPGAMGPSVSFQWIQENNSGACCDHWGLDEVTINLNLANYNLYLMNDNSLIGPSRDTANYFPTTDSTFYFMYTNGIDICFDTVDITINPTTTGTPLTVSCSTLGVELPLSGVSELGNVVWTPSLGLDDATLHNPYANPVNDQMYTVTSDCGVDSIFVNVVPIFEAYANTPEDSICVNDSATLVATSNQPANGYTYTWTNNVQNDTSSTTFVTPTINTMYYLEMISDSGCIRQDSVMIFVGAVPKTILYDGEMRVCRGDSTQITVTAIQPTFFDDFNASTGPNMGIWADIQNGTANTDCGSVSGNALHFNDGPNRWAEIVPVEVLASGGDISFDLFYGNGFGTACSFVGFFDRMELQYLNPTGTNVWEQINQYGIAAGVWTHIVDTIPVGAAGPNTSFRFVQLSHGGTNNDNWAIDNLLIELDCTGTGCVNYDYSWTPTSTITDPISLNPYFFPNTTTTYSLQISPEGFNCNTAADQITISVDEMNLSINPDDTFLCSPSTLLLEAEIVGLSGVCDEQYNLSSIPLNMISGTGTTVSLSDDAITPFITIPFGFEFFCETKTQFNISSNGLINFTATEHGCCAGENIPIIGFANHNDLIALMWEDLNPNNGGVISHFVTGTAPNRVQVIEFLNVPHFGSNSTTVTGQIQIFETSNIVEIHCQNCQDDASGNATLGIENATGTVGYSPIGYNAAQWSATNLAWRFVPSNSPVNYNYSWIAGENISDITSVTPLVSPTQSSEYILQVANINNCLFFDTTEVVIFENTTTLTPNQDLCIGSTLQLNATGADTYAWTPNVALTDTAISNPVTSTTTDITYFVEFNTQGCIANDSVIINVLDLPTTSINNATNPLNYCEDDSKELFVDDLTGWTYAWTGPETGTGSSISVSTPGTYTVTFNDGSCINSLTVDVIENSLPNFDFTTVDQVLCCTDDSTIIDFSTISNNVTIDQVYWNGALANSNSETIYSNEANFVESNTIKIVSTQGCENEIDVPDVTTKCTNPSFTHPDTIFAGTSEIFDLNINETDADNTTYSWTTTDASNGAITNYIVSNAEFNGNENGIYTAGVTVTSIYGNKNCVETAEPSDYEVIDVKDPQYPDAFTPGNDELNEVFKPIISTFAKISEFRIYNRWGDLVYNMETADNKEGWDGKYNGVAQKADQYMYYITVVHPDKEFVTEGVVNLLR